MAVANLKQLQVKKLTGRAISPLHHTGLEAIGVVSPESVFESGDMLVLFGKVEDIERLLQ